MCGIAFIKTKPEVARGAGDTVQIQMASGCDLIELALTRHAALYLQAQLLDILDDFGKEKVKRLRDGHG